MYLKIGTQRTYACPGPIKNIKCIVIPSTSAQLPLDKGNKEKKKVLYNTVMLSELTIDWYSCFILSRAHKMSLHFLSVKCCHPACPACVHVFLH